MPAFVLRNNYTGEMSIKTLASRLWRRLARRKLRKVANSEHEQMLRQAVERLVDEVNPKLRAVSGYRRKLSQAVACSLTFSRQFIRSLPPAVIVSRDTWNSTPMVCALFSGIDDLHQVYSRSTIVRDFFDHHAGADECYALLSMQRSERTVLGMEMRGEVMKRDVKQTSVSFTDRRIVRVAATETGMRRELEDRAFEVMVAYLLERLNELIVSRNSLQEQKQLLDIQVRLARAKQASLLPLFESETDGVKDAEALHTQQRQTGDALEHARGRLTTLDDYIDRITEVLSHPEQHLKINRMTMRLSKMNIKLSHDSTTEGHDLDLTEVSLGTLQRVIMLTRFPRAELLEKQDFLKEAERRLY
jgi:hypothetical protein